MHNLGSEYIEEGSLNIREAYERSLQREGHVRDPAQLEIIARFEDLQARIPSTFTAAWAAARPA